MKVVILAGGYGTRLSEETKSRPKPMVEIGGKPILWHPMDTLRDRQTLEGLWQQGQAQWQSWQVKGDE